MCYSLKRNETRYKFAGHYKIILMTRRDLSEKEGDGRADKREKSEKIIEH